jgi:hypothetical protein
VFSALADFLGNQSILPEAVRKVKGAPRCSGDPSDALVNIYYDKYLKPSGFERHLGINHALSAFNPTTGQNAVWDSKTLQWIDVKTLKPLAPSGDPSDAPVNIFYDKYLKPAGFVRHLGINHALSAFNPTTGQNAVWDSKTLQWIDVKTGHVLGGACTKPPVIPKPTPTPTPGPGTGSVTTEGSPLTAAATVQIVEKEVTDAWNKLLALFSSTPRAASSRAAQPGTVTASGQIVAFRVKGTVVPSGTAGDPGPATQIHLQDLRAQPDGSMKVISTSETFNLPIGGDPNQVSTYTPTNFCVQAGDFPTLSLPPGYNATYYPNGTAYQVVGSVAGSTMSSYTSPPGVSGVGTGAQFTGTDQPGNELLLQWDLATGNKATAICPGGTKTS